jgi:hypothetical protein
MAAIGDVLVKFVADFAEFSTNMEKSRKQLETWGESIAKAGQSLEGFIALAKRVSVAVAFEEIARRVLAWGAAIEQAAVANDKLAKSSGLTTEQIQALQVVAIKTGQSIDELTKIGKQNTDWLEKTTAAYKAHGLILDESVSKPMVEAAEKTELFNRKLDVLFARLYGPTKGSIMAVAAEETDRLTRALQALSAYDSVLDLIRTVFGAQGVNLSDPNAPLKIWTADVERLNAELPKLNQELDALRNNSVVPPGARDALVKEREAIIAAKEAQRDYLSARIVDATAPKMPPTVVPALRPTGGGGTASRTDDDSIQAQINRYNKLTEASKTAYDTIQNGAGQTIEALKRQIAVQEQIDTIAAKLGARYDKADQTLKDQLKAQLTAYAAQRDATQHALEVEQAAVETDKKYGDGTVALTKLHKDLAEQQKNNRITQEDFNRATKEGTEAIQQSALAARRYDDNLGSLAAGFEHAANAFARQNDLFSAGEQAFTGLSTAMMDGLKALEGQSDKTFGQIALNFANMLADMALRAAVSQVFKTVFGAIGGGSVGGADAIMGLVPVSGARAAGGPVSAGQSYVVGEQGPELFVPTAAGNIVPNGANGGGSGDSITVNVDMNSTQGAPDPAKMLQFGRQMKAAIKDVIQNEKRPGGSLYSRVSA